MVSAAPVLVAAAASVVALFGAAPDRRGLKVVEFRATPSVLRWFRLRWRGVRLDGGCRAAFRRTMLVAPTGPAPPTTAGNVAVCLALTS